MLQAKLWVRALGILSVVNNVARRDRLPAMQTPCPVLVAALVGAAKSLTDLITKRPYLRFCSQRLNCKESLLCEP